MCNDFNSSSIPNTKINISIVIDDPMSNVSWIALEPFPDYPGKVRTFYTITQKVAKNFFEIINN